MKKKSMKVQVRELAKNQMQKTKGGNDHFQSNVDGKTVTQTGKKKNASLAF